MTHKGPQTEHTVYVLQVPSSINEYTFPLGFKAIHTSYWEAGRPWVSGPGRPVTVTDCNTYSSDILIFLKLLEASS